MTSEWREHVKSKLVRVPGRNALLRWMRGIRMRRIVGETRGAQEIFTRHYDRKLWGEGESVSGPGSSREYTENLRRELPSLVRSLNVRSLLDAPCGDYNWFRLVRPDLECQYVGGDIVPELVQRNRSSYEDGTTSFVQLDITEGALPKADLWLCRDVLFHLSERDIFRALRNFARSDIRFLLTSTHSECRYNSDIPTGSFRPLNLLLEPYCLPPSRVKIDDWIEGFPVRHMSLWERAEVEDALTRKSRRRLVD